MTKPERDRFLSQFQSAQREFSQWPSWMQEAARIATPTLTVSPDPGPQPGGHTDGAESGKSDATR